MPPIESIGVPAADRMHRTPAEETDRPMVQLWTMDAIAVTASALAVALSCWVAMLLYLT